MDKTSPALRLPGRARPRVETGGSTVRRKEREAFANSWGLSTRRSGPTPEGWCLPAGGHPDFLAAFPARMPTDRSSQQ
jgi:hypothetical protein